MVTIPFKLMLISLVLVLFLAMWIKVQFASDPFANHRDNALWNVDVPALVMFLALIFAFINMIIWIARL